MADDDFASTDDFAAFLHRESLTVMEEQAATLALEAASAAIRRYTNQQIFPATAATFTQWVRRSSQVVIFLPHPPAIPVTVQTVKVDGEELAAEGWEHLTAIHAVQRVDGQLWDGVIEVAYTHGFENPPADLRQVSMQAAERAFANPSGYTTESLGQWSGTKATGAVGVQLTNQEQVLLDPLTRTGVA